MPLVDVAAVRAANPIADAIAATGVELRPSGRRFVARCPFHRDAQPSLTVYPETDSWFCYGCNIGGDVIDFVRRATGRGFRAAVASLTQPLAQPLPANVTPLRTRREPRRLTAEERAVVEASVAHYERSLLTYSDVRAYITGRGVSLRTARELRFGYAAGGLTEHLRRCGLDPAVAHGIGLLNDRGRERFSGRIVIPDLDAAGRATWITGRAVQPRDQKYLDLDVPSPLFGLASVRASGATSVVVVEGTLDRAVLYQWSFPTLALVSAHASEETLRTLATFRRVYLALDDDTAGRLATAKMTAALGDLAATVELPPGVKDPAQLGEFSWGHDAFLRALADAREEWEARWQPNAQPRRAA